MNAGNTPQRPTALVAVIALVVISSGIALARSGPTPTMSRDAYIAARQAEDARRNALISQFTTGAADTLTREVSRITDFLDGEAGANDPENRRSTDVGDYAPWITLLSRQEDHAGEDLSRWFLKKLQQAEIALFNETATTLHAPVARRQMILGALSDSDLETIAHDMSIFALALREGQAFDRRKPEIEALLRRYAHQLAETATPP